MAKITIKLVGQEKLNRILINAGNPQAAGGPLAMALMEEAQLMFNRSQRIVPVDDSILKQSGTIFPPKVAGKRIVVELGYGGAASAYALRQHEDLSLRHKEGKQAKYLETPVRERIPNLEKNIARRLGRILGGK